MFFLRICIPHVSKSECFLARALVKLTPGSSETSVYAPPPEIDWCRELIVHPPPPHKTEFVCACKEWNQDARITRKTERKVPLFAMKIHSFFYNSFITFSTFLFSHDKKKRETFFFSCHIFLSLCQFYVFSVYNHEKAICYFHYVFSCLFIFLLFFVHIFSRCL